MSANSHADNSKIGRFNETDGGGNKNPGGQYDVGTCPCNTWGSNEASSNTTGPDAGRGGDEEKYCSVYPLLAPAPLRCGRAEYGENGGSCNKAANDRKDKSCGRQHALGAPPYGVYGSDNAGRNDASANSRADDGSRAVGVTRLAVAAMRARAVNAQWTLAFMTSTAKDAILSTTVSTCLVDAVTLLLDMARMIATMRLSEECGRRLAGMAATQTRAGVGNTL